MVAGSSSGVTRIAECQTGISTRLADCTGESTQIRETERGFRKAAPSTVEKGWHYFDACDATGDIASIDPRTFVYSKFTSPAERKSARAFRQRADHDVNHRSRVTDGR